MLKKTYWPVAKIQIATRGRL